MPSSSTETRIRFFQFFNKKLTKDKQFREMFYNACENDGINTPRLCAIESHETKQSFDKVFGKRDIALYKVIVFEKVGEDGFVILGIADKVAEMKPNDIFAEQELIFL